MLLSEPLLMAKRSPKSMKIRVVRVMTFSRSRQSATSSFLDSSADRWVYRGAPLSATLRWRRRCEKVEKP
jgi:hypothetical protein